MRSPRVTKEFYEKYESLYQKKPTLYQGDSSYLGKPREEWARLYKLDQNLNNVPLQFFDIRFIAGLGLTLAESVCLHKHIIAYHVIGITPEIYG